MNKYSWDMSWERTVDAIRQYSYQLTVPMTVPYGAVRGFAYIYTYRV